MSLVGIRRSKTVCDVRPEVPSAERNGRGKKRNIFSKMLRSFSKLSKKKSNNTQVNIETDSKAAESFELPGTSFGDVHAHNHGSDSASTGYVSEGSSRRTTDPKQCIVDLDRENKLAKRAHAQRFRPESEFIARSAHPAANQRRASDTDLDRDETDLETDEDRDSEIHSEDSDECPSDSFYTSDCSSSSYVSDDDSRGATNKRFSQPIAHRQQRELRSAVRHSRNERIHERTKSSKLPNIARTMSAREFSHKTPYSSTFTDRNDPLIPAPSAPSPALRARILRLEMGEQIDMEKKCEKSDDSSSVHQSSPRSGNAVKKIASKFLQESSHDSDMSDRPKPENLKRTLSTNSGYKSRPVLEKFAPKLEGESKKEDDDLARPVGIRRTQSTKILDLAANLFQPSEPIEINNAKSTMAPKSSQLGTNRTISPPVRSSRKLPSRSQTCKMASPSAITRRQSSDSFIRELLEMAKVEVNLGDEKPKKINDFKSQICQASTKIARRKTFKESDNIEKPVTCLRSTKSTHTPANVQISTTVNKMEELDPFVKEILNSDTVPKAVKNKIKEECWSLFNDPRTPKGVKQCILNTMLTKTHSE